MIILFVALVLAIGAILIIGMAWRRVVEQALPTRVDERAKATEKADEVMHAPDDDISARIEQLRERGRSGK